MSYSNVAQQLRTELEGNASLAPYSCGFFNSIGENDNNIPRTPVSVEIAVPDGEYISPANDIVSGTTSESEKDFETYTYRIKIRMPKKGYTNERELIGWSSGSTIFDLEKDTRNAIDIFFRKAEGTYSLNLQDLEYGPIQNSTEEGDAHHMVVFDVRIQEEVEIESR